ncbi:MAG: double-strand break repair protein AddB [Maricaulaceae bacterium]
MPKLPVYNMPAGAVFLPSLAAGLVDRLGDRLADALVLLPTRRAVRELGEAFVEIGREDGRGVSLLPRMRPLADIDPDEPPFELGELMGRVSPAIPPLMRRFDMARIIGTYHGRITDIPLTTSGALAIADQLLAILDDAAMEEVSLRDASGLQDISDFAAEHYKNAAALYKVVQQFWPQYLRDNGYMEPMARRVALLNALTDLWMGAPPDYPVIIAGSTGTLKATRSLMKCVAHQKDGMIILPGLDTHLRNSAWNRVGYQKDANGEKENDLGHPQTALKKLIETVGVDRSEVRFWTPHFGGTDTPTPRRRIISEALVPVPETNDWPTRIETIKSEFASENPFETAFDDLSILEADTNDEEAMAIALIMREALEQPFAKAALVTPDPALARRVKSKLRRWDVEVDYSQGEPLEETGLGAFLAGLARLALDGDNPVHLAFIAKHPLTSCGKEGGDIAGAWMRLEGRLFRGPRRLLSDMDAIRALKNHRDEPLVTSEDETDLETLSQFYAMLKPLRDLGESGDYHALSNWMRVLTEVAENVAAAPEAEGRAVLWREGAGEKAAHMLAGVIEYADHLGDKLGHVDARGFVDILASLMRGQVVRPRYGTHPRLQILGPLEARMLTADVVILGGLNEGIWPATPKVEPFLSRGMRQKIGLSLPERRFGLSAHDFAELSANPSVYLTRSKRSDDGPTVASRWLWRLRTLTTGALGDEAEKAFASKHDYLTWARAIDHVTPEEVIAAKAPTPKPPLDQRWPKGRKISVTVLTRLTRDPYAHYAQNILGLPVLDDLDVAVDARQLGTAMHDVLERFAKTYGDDVPETGEALLSDGLASALMELGLTQIQVTAERPRLDNIAAKFMSWHRQSRLEGWSLAGAEITGRVSVQGPLGEFSVSAKSDRIDQRGADYAVVDYKTGDPPTAAQAKAGFEPQLPLQAAMIDKDGFKGLLGTASDLIYLSLRGHNDKPAAKSILDKKWSAQDYGASALEALEKTIAYFDDPDSAYHSQPRIKFTNRFDDYDHLARRAEWAKAGEDPSGGEA